MPKQTEIPEEEQQEGGRVPKSTDAGSLDISVMKRKTVP